MKTKEGKVMTIVAVGPGCWGRGKTEQEAIRVARKHLLGPPYTPRRVPPEAFAIFETEDEKVVLDGLGRFHSAAEVKLIRSAIE